VRAASLDLLVLGDCNPDLVLSGGNVEPAFGQVERIVDRAELVIGGSAAIAACGAARLGLRTALVAVVGRDSFGQFMLDALTERGVDVSGVVIDEERPTGVTVVLARGQDRAILTALGTIDLLSAGQIDKSVVRLARHVHVSSYFLQRHLRPGLADILAAAHAAGGGTSIDPNWDPEEEWDDGLLELLGTTDVLFCNAAEATRIARKDDVEAAARLLAEQCRLVVVKLGGDGALAVSDGEVVRVSSARVEVVDTVGAGDSFDAGFLAAQLDGRSLEESLAIGVACGSLSTRAAGGTHAQALRAEVMPA